MSNYNYDWNFELNNLQSDGNLFSHILDKNGKKKRRRAPFRFVKMESPATFNHFAPQVIKKRDHVATTVNRDLEDENVEFGIKKTSKEMLLLREKVEELIDHWQIRDSIFWSSDIRTLEELGELNVPKEQAKELAEELNKVLLIEKAVEEGRLESLINVVKDNDRMKFKHVLEGNRRRNSKRRLLTLNEDNSVYDIQELSKIIENPNKQIVSDDTSSTMSERPEPKDALVSRYIYKRQKGISLESPNWLDRTNLIRYLGVIAVIFYLILLVRESWWTNYLYGRVNRATYSGYLHFSTGYFLHYLYQGHGELLINYFRLLLAAATLMNLLVIPYPRTIHTLCFYAYGIQFAESWWECFRFSFYWFIERNNVYQGVQHLLSKIVVRYILLGSLMIFHYELMKPQSQFRERNCRIQWRHNEEIWLKEGSNLKMRAKALKWMTHFSRYYHWMKIKDKEPKENQNTWTDTEEFVKAINEPGLDLADLLTFFRRENRFKWVKVKGGWNNMEMLQSDPSLSTDSDIWARGQKNGQVFRDTRKRIRRRKYRKIYRGYGGDYVDKPFAKRRYYKEQERGIKSLLNRHEPQYTLPNDTEINRRHNWFRDRMLVAFKRATYQKGGGVYGGEAIHYGCLGNFDTPEEWPEWTKKKENASYIDPSNVG